MARFSTRDLYQSFFVYFLLNAAKSLVTKTDNATTGVETKVAPIETELKLKRSPAPSVGDVVTRNVNPLVQPKPPKEETALQSKYASIPSLEEKAFHILQDLGMIELTPDPDDPSYDHSIDSNST